MSFYYKPKSGLGSLKSEIPLSEEELLEYEQISEQEWLSLQPKRRQEDSKLKEINILKAELAKTDYQALKYAEGWIPEEDYAPIKSHRQSLRDRINELL